MLAVQARDALAQRLKKASLFGGKTGLVQIPIKSRMKSNDVIDENMPGIQLALFELIWPVFEWIDAIFVASGSNKCSIHVQAAHLPSQDEQDDCERLLAEIFDSVLAGTALHLDVTQDEHRPIKQGYREAMSQAIFKKIAKDVAPWRLDAGR